MLQLTQYTKFLLLPSAICALLLLLVQWLHYHLVWLDLSIELYTGITGVLFLVLGYFIASELRNKDKIEVNKVPVTIEVEKLNSEDLSARECEVLQLMAQGLSNQEIAETLFISVSTVKTHCSSIYLKLDVKRRTSAVEKARKQGLLLR